MIDDDSWNPINDVWNQYNAKLESYKDLAPYGEMDTEEIQKMLWPEDLYFGEDELKDAQEFVAKRTMELMALARKYGLHPDMVYSYIMKSLVSGMLWEKERIG